ncbi:hypothetical protein, variant [Aphanomyces astaci]|uniref:SANT domain-containing protein n=1 Tax=Aphanomyces astaci TaxID=112090 RepID=W4FYH1_APHAT|nr:hypothetical protein, variant [Aphanomyces astaci]ETV72532.1 hypothetical protein, variant [Aphanomyces astaci]|eukprot:XP_009838214.1 hypothetical protein, variant [Aphanomyces astaci]
MSSSGSAQNNNGPPRGTSRSPSRHNTIGELSGGPSSINDRYNSSNNGGRGGGGYGSNNFRVPPGYNNAPMDRGRPSRFDKDPPPYSSYNNSGGGGGGRGGGWNSSRGGRGGFHSQYNKSSRPSRPFRSRSRSRSRDINRRDNSDLQRNRFLRDRSRDRSRDRLRHPPDSTRSPLRPSDDFRHASPLRHHSDSTLSHDHSKRPSPQRHPPPPSPPFRPTAPGLLTPPRQLDLARPSVTSPRPGLLDSSHLTSSSSQSVSPHPIKRGDESPRTTIGAPNESSNPPSAYASPLASSSRQSPAHSTQQLPFSTPPPSTVRPSNQQSSPRTPSEASWSMPLGVPTDSGESGGPARQSPQRRFAQAVPPSSHQTSSSPRPPVPATTRPKPPAAPTTPDQTESKRDELSPLKPFLSRRGSLDLVHQSQRSHHHSTSPKLGSRVHSPNVAAQGTSPSKNHHPLSSQRHQADGVVPGAAARRRSIDEHHTANPPSVLVAMLEETILEPPKPKDDDDAKQQRPRLGWGQGLAAASPTATSTTTKRPRMGWGMGLVVTQVPSPKAQPAPSASTPLLSSPPPALSTNDNTPVGVPSSLDDSTTVGGSSRNSDHQPFDGRGSVVVAPLLPPPPPLSTPDPVDMEIDDDPVVNLPPPPPMALGVPKEDILSSIDLLDAEIADVTAQLVCAKQGLQQQNPQTQTTKPTEELPPPPLCSPVDKASPSKKARPVLVDPKLMAMVQSLMEDNKTKAADAHAMIAALGKQTVQYTRPVDCPGYDDTLVRAKMLHHRVTLRVRRHKQRHYADMKALAAEYGALKKVWRAKVKKLEKDRKKQEKRTKLRHKESGEHKAATTTALDDKHCPNPHPPSNDSQQINHLRSSSRLTNNTQHSQMSMIKHIADVEKEKQAELWDQEIKRKRLKNAMLSSGGSHNSPYVIPDMIVDKELVQIKRFIPLPKPLLTGMEPTPDSHIDGLHYLNAFQFTNPWTDIEKCIFVDKFLQTPKNFFRIASFLQNKTTGDVISFYYHTKKVLDYKAIIREQQLRRRGASIKNTWNCWQLSLCAAMALGVQFPAAIQASVLHQSKFRSHQAAQSILQAAAPVVSKDTIGKADEDDEKPFVLDLTDFLDDNLFTTGYNLTCRSVQSRFDAFRASPDFHPEHPPATTTPGPPSKKAKMVDDSAATASPVAVRRKPTTPRPIPNKGAVKKKSRPAALKKSDDDHHHHLPPPLASPQVPKVDSKPLQSPDAPHPPLLPLPAATPPLFAPVPLTPRTTPTSSSLFLNAAALTNLPPGKRVVQKWTEQEKSDFLKYFSVYGKDWAALTTSIPSKTAAQIKNYYQNYKNRLGLQKRPEHHRPSTPQTHHQTSPSINSPSQGGRPPPPPPPPAFSFPLSIQVPQEYNTSQQQSTAPTSMNAAQHRLIQLQKELSRIQMQQLPTTTSSSASTSAAAAASSSSSMGGGQAFPSATPGSQLKLLQYSLQQQVQMLQMQMYQQSVQDTHAIHQSYGGVPRLNQPSPYYDRYKGEPSSSKDAPLATSEVLLAARPLVDNQTPKSLPPLDPPTASSAPPSVPSRMSFSSILNESVGSPQYASSPSASTPVVIASAPASNRSSMSSLLNRPSSSSSSDISPMLPNAPFTQRSFSSTLYHHPVLHNHRQQLYHDHHHPPPSNNMQDPTSQIGPYHHIHPLQQQSSLHSLQSMHTSQLPSSMHQPIQPMPCQPMLQPIQPLHRQHNVLPIYRAMDDAWTNQPASADGRYDEHTRHVLDKEAAHLREAQEEAAAAALNAAAAAARVEALQRNVVARQEQQQPTMVLAPPRFASHPPPQPPPFHLNLPPRPPLDPPGTNAVAPSPSSRANTTTADRG